MRDEADQVFERFKEACGSSDEKVLDKIILLNNGKRKVRDDARQIYGLKNKKEILDFIANGGMNQYRFLSKEEWRKNPTDVKPLYAFAYKFYTGSLPCYIAIVDHPTADTWFIKSFHPPEKNCEGTLADQFRNLGICDKKGGAYE